MSAQEHAAPKGENGPGLMQELIRGTKTGGGMFVESYFVFAVGNLGTLWSYLYPTCNLKTNPDCAQAKVAITYVQIAAIILAQLTFGILSDTFGRRWGSRLTASLMLLGGILITISFGVTVGGQFAMMNVALFLFCMGVGGEYPMAATAAAERSEDENIKRGRTVTFTFAHQGWGSVANTIVLCFFLAVTNTGGCTSILNSNSTTADMYCSKVGLEVTWRMSYGLGVIVLVALFIYRWTCMKEMAMWETRREKYDKMEKEEAAARAKNFKLLFSRKYFPRLFGAGFSWFVWDVCFYGNKLFQGTIIAAIIGKQSSLLQIMEYTLLNAVIALVGYYFAAFTIDSKWMGRVRMQNMGFAISGILFLACGIAYDTLVQKQNINAFLFMYLASSFWGQWGPNVTTWLLPVELFPTDVRSQAHGICAATGKSGALLATLVFSYAGTGPGGVMDAKTIFLVSGACCIVGLVVTILFVPDVTHLDLTHMDRRFSIDRKSDGTQDTEEIAPVEEKA